MAPDDDERTQLIPLIAVQVLEHSEYKDARANIAHAKLGLPNLAKKMWSTWTSKSIKVESYQLGNPS